MLLTGATESNGREFPHQQNATSKKQDAEGSEPPCVTNTPLL